MTKQPEWWVYLRGLYWMLVAYWLMSDAVRLLMELAFSSWYVVAFRLFFISVGYVFRLILVQLVWAILYYLTRRLNRVIFIIQFPGWKRLSVVLSLAIIATLIQMRLPHDQVLTQPGIYWVEGGDYCITISITDKTLVRYAVQDRTGNAIIQSRENASIVQRWFLYWEPEADRLWVHSSDIGSFVWHKQGGQFVQSRQDDRSTTFSTRTPIPYREKLSSRQKHEGSI